MRQVSTEAIRRAVIGCIERAEYFIDPEIAGAMRCAERSERSPTAKRVLSQLIENCEFEGAQVFTLEVRASNDAAIALYIKHGFMPEGLRKKYYEDNGEDAILMVRRRKEDD